jgi:hypothetical protein
VKPHAHPRPFLRAPTLAERLPALAPLKAALAEDEARYRRELEIVDREAADAAMQRRAFAQEQKRMRRLGL